MKLLGLILLLGVCLFQTAQAVPAAVYYVNTTVPAISGVVGAPGYAFIGYQMLGNPAETNLFIQFYDNNSTQSVSLLVRGCNFPQSGNTLSYRLVPTPNTAGTSNCQATVGNPCNMTTSLSCGFPGASLFWFLVDATNDLPAAVSFNITINEVPFGPTAYLNYTTGTFLNSVSFAANEARVYRVGTVSSSAQATIDFLSTAANTFAGQLDFTLSPSADTQNCGVANCNLQPNGPVNEMICDTSVCTDQISAGTWYLEVVENSGNPAVFDFVSKPGVFVASATLNNGTSTGNKTIALGTTDYYDFASVPSGTNLDLQLSVYPNGTGSNQNFIHLAINDNGQSPSASCSINDQFISCYTTTCPVLTVGNCDLSNGPLTVSVRAVGSASGFFANSTLTYTLTATFTPVPTTPVTVIPTNTPYSLVNIPDNNWIDLAINASTIPSNAEAVYFFIDVVSNPPGNQVRANGLYSRDGVAATDSCNSANINSLQNGAYPKFVTIPLNCGRIANSTGHLYFSIRPTVNGGGANNVDVTIIPYALVPSALVVGVYNSTYPAFNEAALLRSLTVNASTTIDYIVNPVNVTDLIGEAVIYDGDLCTTGGVQVPSAPPTREYVTSSSCTSTTYYFLQLPNVNQPTNFTFTANVTSTPTSKLLTEGVADTQSYAPRLSGQLRTFYYYFSYNQSPDASIGIVTSGTGTYQVGLYSPVSCNRVANVNCNGGGNCNLLLTQVDTLAPGTWWIEIENTDVNPFSITTNLTFGITNCVPYNVTGNEFCASELGANNTIVYIQVPNNAYATPTEADDAAATVYQSYAVLPGANPACLNSIKSYACKLAYRPCSTTGLTASRQGICSDCNQISGACAGVGCIFTGLCNNACAGVVFPSTSPSISISPGTNPQSSESSVLQNWIVL